MKRAGIIGGLVVILLLAVIVGLSVMALRVEPETGEIVEILPNDNFPK